METRDRSRQRKGHLRLGEVTEDPVWSALAVALEEAEEELEEVEEVLTGKEDLALRMDGTTTRERLTGITARVGPPPRPWSSNSLGGRGVSGSAS